MKNSPSTTVRCGMPTTIEAGAAVVNPNSRHGVELLGRQAQHLRADHEARTFFLFLYEFVYRGHTLTLLDHDFRQS